MLHIIFAILKFIGIVLAAILGILVLLLCIVLFVPICYRTEAKCDGTSGGTEVHAEVSWLCHLLSWYAVYQNGQFSWQMRVLWKKLNTEKKQRKKRRRKIKQPKTVPSTEKTAPSTEKTVKEVPETDKMVKTMTATEEPVKSKPGVREKSEKNIFEKIKYTFRNICDKIKVLLEKKEKMEEFLLDTVHQSAFRRVCREAMRLGRFLRPGKLRINLCFGFEDPYYTGKMLALLSMLYPVYGEYMNINPNFENRVLEGDLFVRGRIHGIYAVIIIWNLFFDKNIRAAYKHIKALEI